MKGVIDTNVMAYFLLRTEPFFRLLEAFFRKNEELLAPDIWRPELLNVLWMAVRNRKLTQETAGQLFQAAGHLVTQTIPSNAIWRSALKHSCTAEHPVYDTFFVALAERENVPLWTFDKKIMKHFPGIARKPVEGIL